MGSPDLVSVVESAYSLAGSDETWLGGVLSAARPVFDRGLGVAGYFFDATDPARTRVLLSGSLGVDDEFTRLTTMLVESAPPEIVERTYLSGLVCATASEATGLGDKLPEFGPYKFFADQLGMRDNIGLKVVGPKRGQGFMLHAPLAEVERTTAPFRRAWSRVAAHIAAGYRLREALSSSDADVIDGAEAVLDAEGGVHHLEGAAKQDRARRHLQSAVAAMERARGALRHDPDEALAIWKGLVSGRWSLIEHFESSGRRYLVARRNDPRVRDPRALTPRERQVLLFLSLGHSDKLIAYELGMGVSTVATHTRRIKAKLAVGTRTELIALAKPLLTAEGGTEE